MHYLQSKKLYIFDMDGTVYLGNRVFPFAVDFISELRREGKQILFFTNNASHSPDHYINKLTRLGLNPSREELLTSGDVTIGYLNRHRAGKKVFLVGTPELCEQFTAGNVKLSEDADIVVTSFDTTLTYEKLRIACQLIHNGAEYLCTHPDFNCPVENGFIPDSGSIAALVTASTGVTPRYFGKPHTEAINAICDITEVNTKDMVIFGDRLYTDIAFGKRHGITSVLVLTGETKQRDVKSSDAADYVFPSLLEVHELWNK